MYAVAMREENWGKRRKRRGDREEDEQKKKKTEREMRDKSKEIIYVSALNNQIT